MPVDLSVFDRTKSVNDYLRAEEEFQMRKREALLKAQGGGSSPAAVQIANEIQKARANGDTQRINDLLMSAKMLDRGIIQDAQGNPVEMAGYGQALGGIAGVKKAMETQGQKNVEAVMNPIIAGGESRERTNAANQSDLGYKPKIEAEIIKAKNKAQGGVDLPGIEDNAEQMNRLIDDIRADPGLSAVVGAPNPLKGRVPGIGNVPGTPAADFQAKLDQLGGKQFLEAFQSLKGGGQITEVEGQKATNAIGRMQTSQSEGEFLKALDELKGVVDVGVKRARAKAGAEYIPTGQSLFEKGQAEFNTRKPKPRLKFNPATGRIE